MDVTAWIVAITKYETVDGSLSIRQPVGLLALDWAEWMLERGAKKVVLSTSLQADAAYDARMKELEAGAGARLERTGASSGQLQDALLKLHGQGCLMVYWVGHGVAAPSRQLLCADSTSLTDLRTIGIPSLLRRLRSDAFPRRQMGFFDCCAQVSAVVPGVVDAGVHREVVTEQYFYHAASIGEIASGSLDVEGFSSVVFETLEGYASFPPEAPAKFMEVLKEELASVPLHTRPVLEQTSGSGDVWLNGNPDMQDDLYNAAKAAELSSSQFMHLWDRLRTVPRSPADLLRALQPGKMTEFLETLQHDLPDSVAPFALGKAHAQLQLQQQFEDGCLGLRLLLSEWIALYDRLSASMLLSPEGRRMEDLSSLLLGALDQASAERGSRLLIQLLELAARAATGRSEAAAWTLRGQIKSHALLGPLYESSVKELPALGGPLYLLLGIEWDRGTGEVRLARAFTHPGLLDPFDEPELPESGRFVEQVHSVIQTEMQKNPGRELRVELLLPTGLLGTPRDLLLLEDAEWGTSTWLETQHPITLRWGERMKGKDGRYSPGSWATKAAAHAHWGRVAPLVCAWHPAPVETCGMVALPFAPPSPEHPKRNQTDFMGELLKGAPYMCWPRDPPQDPAAYRRAVDDLLAGVNLDELPLRLCELRPMPLFADLLLFIDEPKRNPYVYQPQLTNTAQRGQV